MEGRREKGRKKWEKGDRRGTKRHKEVWKANEWMKREKQEESASLKISYEGKG